MILRSASSPEIPVERFAARLNAVRRGIAAWFWVEGLARVLWLILVIAAADLLLDWLFRMDRPQRAVMLVLLMFGLLAAIYRWLLRPLTTPISDDALVLQVEKTNPRVGQALITSLQLARSGMSGSKGASPSLLNRAIALGAKTAEEIRFADIIETRRFTHNAMLLTAAMTMCFAVAAATPFVPPLRIWFSRNLLLSRSTWPQKTYLVIDRLRGDGTVVFPRGTAWTQAIYVRDDSRVRPDAVYLDIKERGRGRQRRSLLLERASEREFEAAFANVTEPFEFRARGGDAVTDWVRVELANLPELRELKVMAMLPQYAGQVHEELSAAQGSIEVLRGSSLNFKAAANKRLAKGELVRGEIRWALQIVDTGDGSKIQLDLAAAEIEEGLYSIELVDMLGLTNRAPSFHIRWRPDREPEVSGKLNRVGAILLPQARISYDCQAKDDFGLTAFDLVVSRSQDDKPADPLQVSLAKPSELGVVGQPTTHRQVDVIGELDLEPLMLSAGTNLKLQFQAADNDDIGPPHVGRSNAFFLRVVSEDEFRTDLLRREKLERQELERLMKAQDELVTDSRALAAAATSTGFSGVDLPEQLSRIYRSQKASGQKLAAIADRLLKMSLEIRTNGLLDGERMSGRLDKDIAAPLKSIADNRIRDVMKNIEILQLAAADNRPLTLSPVIDQQVQITAALKRVLEQMISSQGFQEAIDLLYQIQKAQSDVYEQTNKAREERVKRILEGRN